MTEKMKPTFEVIKGGQEYVIELSAAVQSILKNLPEDVHSLVNKELVVAKRGEVILWSHQELLEYLKGESLFKDSDTASLTWAVIDVTKGKITPAI